MIDEMGNEKVNSGYSRRETRLTNMARFAQINAPVDSLARRRNQEKETERERKEKRAKRRSATHWRVSGNRLSAAAWRPEIERSQPSSEIEVQEEGGGRGKKSGSGARLFLQSAVD